MTIFLVLAPYGAFTTLMLVTSAMLSVFAAACICIAVIALDAVRGRSVKLLGAGSTVLFATIGSYLALIDPTLSTSKVKLAVDTGVFIISAGSILVRYPFTLQYALESVPAETASMPGFLRANYVITGAWTAAALLMMLSNLAMLYAPGLPIWTGLLIAFAARNSAVYFTKWYPHYRKLKSSMPPPRRCQPYIKPGSLTETDDEGRATQACDRLPLRHPLSGSLSRDRQHRAGDLGCNCRCRGSGDPCAR